MFADRYFGKRYFGNRYFGPGGDEQPAVVSQPGGGYYKRPIIYLDDKGRPVDLETYGKPAPPIDELAPTLPPEVLMALLFPQPPDETAALLARLEAAEGQMGQFMLEQAYAAYQAQQAEDEEALVLLLAS